MSETKSAGPIAVLAEYASSSVPGKVYRVTLGGDEVVYCDCGPWRFQRGVAPKDRKPCQHIRKWRGQ